MSKKKPKSPTRAPETASEIAESIAVEALSAVRREIRGVIDGSGPSRRGDKVARVAALAQKAAAVAAEQRKAQKAELAAILRLTPQAVMTWIRQQAPEYRARLVREVTAIDAPNRRSVLG